MDVFIGPAFEKLYEEHPLVLVDVGARGGLPPHWRRAERHLHVVGFEADPEEHAELARFAPANVTYIPKALAGAPGRVALNITRAPRCSSVLAPNRSFLDEFPESDRFDVISVAEVEAGTLDEELPAHGMAGADFLKVDTQGSELPILRGAERTLADHVMGVEVEVEFSPMYEDQPLFADVDPYLRDLGFTLFDLRPGYWKRTAGMRYGKPKGQIIFADALYLREAGSFGGMLAPRESGAARAKAAAALSVSIVYGYLDYAQALFSRAAHLFTDEQRREFESAIARSVTPATRIPAFKGRGVLGELLRRAYESVTPPLHGWASGGRRLGNL